IILVLIPIKPTVTLQPPWTQIYSGETISVRCEIQGGEGAQWTYEWRQDQVNIPDTSSEYRIIRVTESDSGGYSCRGKRTYLLTEWSDTITLSVSLSNRPVVTLYPNWSEIYRGETITVRCEIHGGDTEWDYEWETNSMIKAPNQNEYRIRSASSFNSGNYRCKGRMKSSQHETTEWSDSVTLTVSDNEPRPVLTVSPSWLSPGASVTLNCEVEHPSAGWSFYWYKATHTAGYVCRAGRGDPEYHTDHSQPKFVWSAVPSKPTVTLQPPWTQIYSGETVSVSCEIQGGEGAQWTYEWRPNKLNTPPTSSEYRIITVTESDSGGYSCRGTRTYMLTKWSDIITLSLFHLCCSVKYFEKQLFIPRGSVTLTCSVNLSSPSSSSSSSSSGWKYYWYRDWKSYQPVTNGQISVSEGGRYSCRGGKGEPVYYTEYSESVRIDTTGEFKL
uniref:Ig-like domain-containing protein n=1 Tax=Neolamprologus brichardi TaxID=32507 RepID=A0A3Q4IFH1_NEOBR